jgi:hypothetical protein
MALLGNNCTRDKQFHDCLQNPTANTESWHFCLFNSFTIISSIIDIVPDHGIAVNPSIQWLTSFTIISSIRSMALPTNDGFTLSLLTYCLAINSITYSNESTIYYLTNNRIFSTIALLKTFTNTNIHIC